MPLFSAVNLLSQGQRRRRRAVLQVLQQLSNDLEILFAGLEQIAELRTGLGQMGAVVGLLCRALRRALDALNDERLCRLAGHPQDNGLAHGRAQQNRTQRGVLGHQALAGVCLARSYSGMNQLVRHVGGSVRHQVADLHLKILVVVVKHEVIGHICQCVLVYVPTRLRLDLVRLGADVLVGKRLVPQDMEELQQPLGLCDGIAEPVGRPDAPDASPPPQTLQDW